jgi:DNA phosphorothioation-associated putative methyltransferase
LNPREIDTVNLIKLHRRPGKVSYLIYPNFETDPHPALLRTVKLSLRTQEIDCLEYGRSVNPPIFHRKEALLAPDDPRRAKFARLTAQEERARLLAETASIGTRRGWAERLTSSGYALRGHRLMRSNPSRNPPSRQQAE